MEWYYWHHEVFVLILKAISIMKYCIEVIIVSVWKHTIYECGNICTRHIQALCLCHGYAIKQWVVSHLAHLENLHTAI